MIKNTTYINIPLQKEVELKQFIRGSLLGDGCIPKLGKGSKNHKMTFGHGPKQYNYLLWKNEFLKSYSLAGKITTCVSYSKRYKSGSCESYHFKSSTHPIFTNFYNLYYKNGKRIVDREDILNMNEFALAIWVMDDAHVWYRKKRNPCMVLNTTNFSKEDVMFLIEILYDKWKINSSYLKHDNNIRIPYESSKLLGNIIKPFIHKELDYKRVLYKEEELLES